MTVYLLTLPLNGTKLIRGFSLRHLRYYTGGRLWLSHVEVTSGLDTKTFSPSVKLKAL